MNWLSALCGSQGVGSHEWHVRNLRVPVAVDFIGGQRRAVNPHICKLPSVNLEGWAVSTWGASAIPWESVRSEAYSSGYFWRQAEEQSPVGATGQPAGYANSKAAQVNA